MSNLQKLEYDHAEEENRAIEDDERCELIQEVLENRRPFTPSCDSPEIDANWPSHEVVRTIAETDSYLFYKLVDYIIYGTAHGHSFARLVENDLVGFVTRSDNTRFSLIKELTMFLHWHMPYDAWGSPDTVKEWDGLIASAPMEEVVYRVAEL